MGGPVITLQFCVCDRHKLLSSSPMPIAIGFSAYLVMLPSARSLLTVCSMVSSNNTIDASMWWS
jgi:hypothetical protein